MRTLVKIVVGCLAVLCLLLALVYKVQHGHPLIGTWVNDYSYYQFSPQTVDYSRWGLPKQEVWSIRGDRIYIGSDTRGQLYYLSADEQVVRMDGTEYKRVNSLSEWLKGRPGGGRITQGYMNFDQDGPDPKK